MWLLFCRFCELLATVLGAAGHLDNEWFSDWDETPESTAQKKSWQQAILTEWEVPSIFLYVLTDFYSFMSTVSVFDRLLVREQTAQLFSVSIFPDL